MRIAAPLAALALVSALPVHAAAASLVLTGTGVWRNPHDSVHIALRPCGEEICGFVVYASAKAEAAARKGGTPKLLGGGATITLGSNAIAAVSSSAWRETASAAVRASSTTCPACAGTRTPRQS